LPGAKRCATPFAHWENEEGGKMAQRSLGRTVGNLALALLNATLVLIALCFWLAWSAFSAAERVTSQVEQAAQSVLPVRGEIRDLTAQIEGTRAELVALRDRGEDGGGAVAELSESVAAIEAQLAVLADEVSKLNAAPGAMIDRAVEASFRSFGDIVAEWITRMRGESRSAPDV
jgi:hypothetical protein